MRQEVREGSVRSAVLQAATDNEYMALPSAAVLPGSALFIIDCGAFSDY